MTTISILTTDSRGKQVTLTVSDKALTVEVTANEDVTIGAKVEPAPTLKSKVTAIK